MASLTAVAALALLLGLRAAAEAAAEAAAPASRWPNRRLQASLVYPDATNVDCNLGENCTGNAAGSIPAERGLCVQGLPGGTGNQCWDVCNPAHLPSAYQVTPNKTENTAYHGLVAQVRAGKNSFVQCPGELHTGGSCEPGEPCGAELANEFDVEESRGMCVVDASVPRSRACWDMCDGRRRPDQFEVGTEEGVARKVEDARRGATCADGVWPWWVWVMILLMLACCAAVLCVSLGCVKTKRGRPGGMAARGLDYEQGDDERRQQLAGQQDAYEQQKQRAFEEHFRQGEHRPEDNYAQDGPDATGVSHQRDIMGDDYGPGLNDSLPPEPPRPGTYTDVPPPEPSPFVDRDSHGRSGYSGPASGRQSLLASTPPPEPSPFPDESDRSGYMGSALGRPSPLGSTRAIPGLDEPCLFPSVQPLVMPTATAQVAPPEMLGLTSQLVPPGGQQNALSSGQRVAMPAYALNNAASYQTPGSGVGSGVYYTAGH